MELRRLQKTKGGSYILTLPKTWISKLKLNEGSILSLEEGDQGFLLIKPYVAEKEAEVKPAVISAEAHVSVERGIRSAYLVGAEQIKVESSRRISAELREKVISTIQRLIGMEIVEETSNSITAQSLLQLSAVPVKSTLKRAYNIVYNMHKDALTAIKEFDGDLAKDLIKRDDEVDKLYFLIVRQLRAASQDPLLASKLGIKTIDCLDLRLAAKYVEAIGDSIVRIAEGVLDLQKANIKDAMLETFVEEVVSLGNASLNLHEGAMNALLKGDVRLAEQVSVGTYKLDTLIDAVSRKLWSSFKPHFYTLYSVALHLYQIGEYGVDLAELVTYRPESNF